jgi:WD40 repeat protein
MSSPQSVVAHAKAVQGVCFDPFHNETVATFSEEGVIKLWDIRNFVEPVENWAFAGLTVEEIRI